MFLLLFCRKACSGCKRDIVSKQSALETIPVVKLFSGGTSAQKRVSIGRLINAVFFIPALYEMQIPVFVPDDFAKIFSFAR